MGYPKVLGEKLSQHYNNKNIKVYNCAIGGGRTYTGRLWMKRDITGIEADIVTIMFGHNQKAYKVSEAEDTIGFVADHVNYLEEAAGLMKKAPAVIIVTTNPSALENLWDSMDSYAQGLRDFTAKNKNIMLVDFMKYFKAMDRNDYKQKFLEDTTHPSTNGNNEMAELILKAIIEKEKK
ncbi:MAG: hypothetical protein A2231_04575 [Candidatus Firestonebacteria bacterium RIFOXYA2_FULL_40_8]|nr:MAG: hypothetical protein A2231_04575 [Candidatus Firestonebacteria bacterium RIFOXYA2_FULL_40_8]